MGDSSFDNAFFRRYKLHILGTDYHIHGTVGTEAFIHTGKARTQNFNQAILYHGSTDNIAVADKVCHEGVFGLIVDALRRTDLLDIALVHDYDGIGHGKGLLLIVGDINKGDPQLVFQTDQLILHILAKL